MASDAKTTKFFASQKKYKFFTNFPSWWHFSTIFLLLSAIKKTHKNKIHALEIFFQIRSFFFFIFKKSHDTKKNGNFPEDYGNFHSRLIACQMFANFRYELFIFNIFTFFISLLTKWDENFNKFWRKFWWKFQ